MRSWDPLPTGAPGFSPFQESRLAWAKKKGGSPSTPGGDAESGDENTDSNDKNLSESERKAKLIQDYAHTLYTGVLANPKPNDKEVKKQLNAEAIQKKIDTSLGSITKMKDGLKAKLEKIEKLEKSNPEFVGLSTKWHEMQIDLEHEEINLAAMRNVVDKLNRWEKGLVPPTEFRDWLVEFHKLGTKNDKGGEEKDDEVSKMVESVNYTINGTRGSHVDDPLTSDDLPDITDPNMWEKGLNGTAKAVVISRLSAQAYVPEKLAFINDRLDFFEKTLKEYPIQDSIDSVDKADLPTDKKSAAGVSQGVFESMNIKFYSINQVIDGFKKWKEEYTNSLKGYNSGKSDLIAKKAGKMFSWLPFGEDVRKNLDDKVANNQAKERKDFMDVIVTRDFGFNDLYKPGGLLAQSAGSPSRFLSTLEFGSQKGWLYPLMKYNFIDANYLPGVEAFGFNIRSVIPQEYMSDDLLASYLNGLLGKSNSNGNKDMSEAMGAIEGRNDIDSFVDIFDKAMKGNGFWKAIGILNGAMKKGKDGATAGIFAARLHYWLRQPGVSQYMNDTILGKFAGASFNQVPFSMAYYGANAKDIVKWAQTNTEPGKAPTEAKDQLTLSIIEIEKVLSQRLDRDKKLTDLEKSKIIGKVLSGQTADLGNGRSISIFEPQFELSRKNADIWQYFKDFDMRTASSDYFANSEIYLLPESFLNTLFDISSTGQLPYGSKIVAYSEGIITRAYELDKKARSAKPEASREMAAAAATFRGEIFKKLTAVIKNKLLDRSNIQDMMKLQFETGTFKGRFVLPELVMAGLLDADAIGLQDNEIRRAA